MINKGNLVGKTIRGTVWIYISRYSARFVVFINTIILARLLSKEDFGVAGYAILALNLIDFVDGLGVRQALIYYDEDDSRYNSGFWLGIGVGSLLGIVSFFVVAPLAGIFFKDARAVPVTQVLVFTIPISSFEFVHTAILQKKLYFKRQVWPELAHVISKGVVSISLAFTGFGAWSLIFGQLVGNFIRVVTYWRVIPWRPRFDFEFQHIRSLISYGKQIIFSRFFVMILANADYMLVGRYLGAEALGVYTLAFRIPELLIRQFNSIIAQVTFPVFVSMGREVTTIERGLLLTIKYVNLLTVPVGLGLALVAKPTLLVFFGEKWIEGVPVMVAISSFFVLEAMVFNFGDLYKALGRPDLLAKIHTVQTIVTVPVLWWAVTVPGTTVAVAWTQVVLGVVVVIGKLLIANQIMETTADSIIKSFIPSLSAGVPMGFAVYGMLKVIAFVQPVFQLVVCISVGGVVYVGFLWLFQKPILLDAIQSIRLAVNRQ